MNLISAAKNLIVEIKNLKIKLKLYKNTILYSLIVKTQFYIYFWSKIVKFTIFKFMLKRGPAGRVNLVGKSTESAINSVK